MYRLQPNHKYNLTFSRKGIADEQLAKREEERGRKRALDENHPAHSSTKRSRSSYSSTSVSTISTNYSHSISSRHPKSRQSDTYHLSQSRSGQPFRQQGTHKRRRSSSSTSTYSSSSSVERRKPSRRKEESDRNTRRRRSSISPDTRGRDRDYNGRRSSRRSRSQSKSIDRSRVARNRNSMTPGMRSNHDRDGGRNTVTWGNGRRYSTNDDDRYGGSYRDEGRGARDGVKAQKPPPPLRAKKERSLSPFSKRLALTQAMNSGRG